MKNLNSAGFIFLASLFFVLNIPRFATAGFMDKINSATQKIQQSNDKKNTKIEPAITQPAQPGPVTKTIKDPVPVDTQKTQANTPPLNEKQKCLAGIHGLYWKMLADKLEQKMNSKKLTAPERKAWESEIAILREAWNQRSNTLPPTGHKDPRWYEARLTPDERLALSLELSSTKSKATKACMNMRKTDKYINGQIMSAEQAAQSKSSVKNP